MLRIIKYYGRKLSNVFHNSGCTLEEKLLELEEKH